MSPSLMPYSNLICISIGFCFAYTVFFNPHTSPSRGSFLGFLDGIANTFINNIGTRTKKEIRDGGDTLAGLENALQMDRSNEEEIKEARGAVEIAKEIIEEMISTIKKIAVESESKISLRTRAKNLSRISVVIGVYGIVLLFLAAIEQNTINSINIYPILIYVDAIITIFLITCCISEFEHKSLLLKEKNKICRYYNNTIKGIRFIFYPSWIVTFIFLFAISLGILYIILFDNIYMSINDILWCAKNKVAIRHYTIVLLFSGFISYFILAVIYSGYIVYRFIRKLKYSGFRDQLIIVKKIAYKYRGFVDLTTEKLRAPSGEFTLKPSGETEK